MKAPSSSRDSKRKQVSSCSSTCALALYTGSEKCSGLRADSYLYNSSSFCRRTDNHLANQIESTTADDATEMTLIVLEVLKCSGPIRNTLVRARAPP